MNDCIFCQLPGDREIASSAGYRLAWCLGPVTRGHVVMVPDVHEGGLLDLPKERLPDLDRCRQEIRRLWKDRYGGCMLIEHGRHGHDRQRYHSHAHLHIIPLAISIRSEIITRYGDPIEGSYSAQRVPIAGEYLFLADEEGNDCFVMFGKKPPRMVFRSLLARQLGVPEKLLDWKVFPRREIAAETRSDALAILEGTENTFTLAENFDLRVDN
ncbi:MAG: hypothetical protein ABW090_15745 [Sedimenticola sp.]